MGPFSDLAIPESGMSTYRIWLNAISDNVANINVARRTDEAAFQERYVVAKARNYGDGPGAGVEVAEIRYGDPRGRLVYEPDNPLADAEGYVRMPDIDLADQMTQMLVAQRAYQLNVTVFERTRDAYSRALEIGR